MSGLRGAPLQAAFGRPSVPVVLMFGIFAFCYFLSTLLRAVTATLAPVFSDELGLRSGDLGLLAGAYFIGFAALQLPLGKALDRFGPRRTLVALSLVAVAGCAAFAAAQGFAALVAARMLIGAGVAASLMAPLTAYRHHLSEAAQLRANSWMLMTGSFGMLASTLPVQWLMPWLGWRGLFWLFAGLLALSAVLVWWRVPRDVPAPATPRSGQAISYLQIARHPLFLRTAPLAFFVYGGLIAVQALWAGPWLTRVAGWSAGAAAQGLFGINLAMLLAFGAWGLLMPRLTRLGVQPVQLIAWGTPLPLLLMALIVALGEGAGAGHWVAWCVACSVLSLCQPAVGAAFPSGQAGRALSAFNLVIFAGVFATQWGLGLVIDGLRAAGWSEVDAFRWAFSALGLCGAASYAWFHGAPGQAAHNRG